MSRRRPHPRCQSTRKLIFYSETHALLYTLKRQAKGDSFASWRVYKCPHCKKWHTTRAPAREAQP